MSRPTSEVLVAEVARTGEGLSALPRREQRQELTRLYRALVDADVPVVGDIGPVLRELREPVTALPFPVWNGLDNRPRTFYRLLVAGAGPAAEAALLDARAPALTNGPASLRTASKEPAFVHVEGGRAFAWLPGFRDPRFDAPDDCYDISDEIELRATVDAVALTSQSITLGGTAVLSRGLPATPGDVVQLVLARRREPDVVVTGRRLRRTDLVAGGGRALTRQAWSGWSVTLDLAALPAAGATGYELSLAVAHDAVRRTAPLGESVDDLLARRRRHVTRRRRTSWTLQVEPVPWLLTSSYHPPPGASIRSRLHR